MIARPDREDTTRQQDAIKEASGGLASALAVLAGEVRTAGKAAARGQITGKPAVDEDALRAAWNQVDRELGHVEVRIDDLRQVKGQTG